MKLMLKLKTLARAPLIHFLLIGAGIYVAYGLFAAGEDVGDERTITVSANDIQALSDQWIRLRRQSPTEVELASAVRDHVRTQILYREAVAMGLDQGDVVIERRLAQKVELLAQGLIAPGDPTEEELREWYGANQDEFKRPDLYTVAHIFFDPDKRDATTLDDAKTTLAELRELGGMPVDITAYGDRIMLQNYYPSRTELDLQKLFGGGFVEQIVTLQPDRWHGPILSGYGVHLVFVSDVVRPPVPAFESVEPQVREQWLAGKIDEMSERFLENLILLYEVEIEDPTVVRIGYTP